MAINKSSYAIVVIARYRTVDNGDVADLSVYAVRGIARDRAVDQGEHPVIHVSTASYRNTDRRIADTVLLVNWMLPRWLRTPVPELSEIVLRLIVSRP